MLDTIIRDAATAGVREVVLGWPTAAASMS